MSYCTPHENADGSEPFGKQWNEVPFFARIIHMCDTIDIFCRSMKSDSDEWKRTEEFVIKSKDKLFDSFCVEVFFNAFSDEKIHMIDNETLDTMLWKKVPRIKLELNFAQIKAIADLFAHIVDYKSPFTSNHSMGVAEGAEKISRFMGFDEDICQKMYIAGALHDIGKVAIGNEILEKPEKLTDEEFKTMKHHAEYTYYILSGIDDFEEIHLGSNIESAKGINPFNKKNRAICNYTQTDGASSLEISMDENLFDLLDIENKDHKLIIKAKSGKKICPTHLVLNTSSKNLKEAGISGSIDFIADQPLQLTNTSFYISGVGDVKLADLSCDTFKVAISGVGNIYLNGNIKKGKYSVSGVGHVYAFDCPVEDLECEVSGVGGMEVNATQKLDASTSGVGSVKYKGNPEHTQKSASGVGKIKQAD